MFLFQVLLDLKASEEQLEDLVYRELKEKKAKMGNLGCSMFAGEERHVLVVLSLFTKVGVGYPARQSLLSLCARDKQSNLCKQPHDSCRRPQPWTNKLKILVLTSF